MKQVELLLLLQEQLDAEDKTLFHVRQIEDEVTGEVITTAKMGRGFAMKCLTFSLHLRSAAVQLPEDASGGGGYATAAGVAVRRGEE